MSPRSQYHNWDVLFLCLSLCRSLLLWTLGHQSVFVCVHICGGFQEKCLLLCWNDHWMDLFFKTRVCLKFCVCVYVCLPLRLCVPGQSTYKRVNFCNRGCPFKGPSQICPGPFYEPFCDSPALIGPQDGRLHARWKTRLVGHGWWDSGLDPHNSCSVVQMRVGKTLNVSWKDTAFGVADVYAYRWMYYCIFWFNLIYLHKIRISFKESTSV